MRRHPLILLLAVAALLLSGCFKIDLQFTVNSDDTVDGAVVMAMSKEMQETLSQFGDEADSESDEFSIDQESLDKLGDKAKVEDYDDGKFSGQKVTFKRVSLAEFAEFMDDQGEDGDDSSEFSLTRDGDKYRFSGQLDTSELTGEAEGEDDLGMGGMFESMMKEAELKLSVTFPGKVIESNGKIDGNTVTWNLLEMNDEQAATAVAMAGSSSGSIGLWIALGVILALILAAVAFLLVRSRSKKAATSPAPVPPAPTAPAPTTPAPAAPVETAPVDSEPAVAEPDDASGADDNQG